MKIELGVTPVGHLRCYSASTETVTSTSVTPVPAVIEKAFGIGIGDGLFALSNYKNTVELSPRAAILA